MRPLHVLLIAESFPPSAYVGSIRAEAVSRALQREGHRVTVIRSAAYATAGRLPSQREGPRVLTVTALENPIRVLARHNPFRVEAKRAGVAPTTGPRDGREPLVRRLRRWVLSLSLLPDDSQGFIPAAVFAALDHHRGDRFDLLMTTAPPFSDHLIGVLLARLLAVPWVAEFRDPWLPRVHQTGARSALADGIEQRLENLVLRRADLVVAVTPSTGRSLDLKRLDLGKPGGTLVALNGVPALQPAAHRPADGPIRVLHAGVLYLKRDPRPFLRAVAAGVRAGRFGPAGVRVCFMGSSGGEFEGQSVTAMAEALGIGECVELLGQRPIEECRELMARADVLLLLAQLQPAQIPNKLYDYLAAGRPIIGYVDADGDSAAVLQRVGGHHLVFGEHPGQDDSVIEAILASREWPEGSGMDPGQLHGLLTEVQLAPLVQAVERLAGGRSPLRVGAAPRGRALPDFSHEPPVRPRRERIPRRGLESPGAVGPLVSVIIPAWNVARHVGEAVRSVLAQTVREWELIVVNDGSPDTVELERALKPYEDRLTYLVQENLGPGAARNTAISAATGTWVAFLDGDDAWHPEYLHHQIAMLESAGLDMVYSDAELVGGRGRAGVTYMDLAPSTGSVTVEALLSARCNVITSGAVVRRRVLNAVGNFPNRRAQSEDFNTWLRVALSGARIGYQRRVLLRHRVRPDGLTGDAVSAAARAVQALTDAGALPLGLREERARQRSLRRMTRRLELEQAKNLIVLGQYRQARRRLWSVVARHPRPRSVGGLVLLYLLPGLVKRHLLALRAGPPRSGAREFHAIDTGAP